MEDNNNVQHNGGAEEQHDSNGGAEEVGSILRPEDVWLGRGNGPRNHPGTLRKVELIERNLDRYKAAAKEQREVLYQEVYDTIEGEGGHFVEKVGILWMEVPYERAIQSIKQGFNNKDQRQKSQENQLAAALQHRPNADVHPDELLPIHFERMARARTQALQENSRLRDEIAQLRATNAAQTDDLRSQLGESNAARKQLETFVDQLQVELAELKGEASQASAGANQLPQRLVKEPSDLISLDEIQAVFRYFANAEDSSSDLNSAFESLSVDESNEQQRDIKVAKTSNSSDSSPAVRGLPEKYDARTIITGLSDWTRSFIDQAQNLKEMKVVQEMAIKSNVFYRGSILRGKPHGLV